LEGSISSSIYQLNETNREKIIAEVLSRLTGWNESSKPGAAAKDLSISVTILNRNLEGDGILLAISDDNLRRKRFSQENYVSLILYVDCEENCFFVSIYLSLLYNKYYELFENAEAKSHQKRINEKMFQAMEKKRDEIER